MRRRARQRWWLLFGGGAMVVIVALAWVTVVLLELERKETAARADAAHQESLRLALWRMDSWLAPQLAREAARPYFEYEPFYAQDRAYTKVLSELEPGEIYAPSPLLTFASDLFRLHFQLDEAGRLSSPQVPQENFRDLAESGYVTGETIRSNELVLAELGQALDVAPVQTLVQCATENLAPPALVPAPAPPQQQLAQGDSGQVQSRKSQIEWSKRAQSANVAQQSLGPPGPSRQKGQAPEGERVSMGPLVPIWVSGDGKGASAQLVFIREGNASGQGFYQGILADWPRLRTALLEQINDLFPTAALVPVPVEEVAANPAGNLLATIPVTLVAPRPAPPPVGLLTPARATLGLTWLAVMAALAAAMVSLRASIAYGEKRSRFASAVTHELRTPLTTFRMYSEMLADEMVPDEAQRKTYLETLKDESSRLATLVENVLSYARLEDGRAPVQPVSMTLGELLERTLPPLHQRAERTDMRLEVENSAGDDMLVRVDADAVGQILFNLVENACKYAGDAADRRIHLEVERVGRPATAVGIRVRDRGPGVPPRHAGSIFSPFERGAREPGDVIGGVGLGLALARGLARDLGGDLVLEPRDGDGAGACFRLTLPTA